MIPIGSRPPERPTQSTPGPITVPGETRATRSARAARLSRIAQAARESLGPTNTRSIATITHVLMRPSFVIPPPCPQTPHPIHGFRPVNSTTSAGFHSHNFGAIVENTSRFAQERNQAYRRCLINPWLSRRAWLRKAAALTVQRGLAPGEDLGHFKEAVKVVVAGEDSEHRIRIPRPPEGFKPETGHSIKARCEKIFDSFYYHNQTGSIMLVLDSREERESRIQIEEMNWIVEYVRMHSWETLIHDDWAIPCRAFTLEMRRFINENEMRKKWYFFYDWVTKMRGSMYAGRFVKRMEGL